MSVRTVLSAAAIVLAAFPLHAHDSLGIDAGGLSFGALTPDSTERL